MAVTIQIKPYFVYEPSILQFNLGVMIIPMNSVYTSYSNRKI